MSFTAVGLLINDTLLGLYVVLHWYLIGRHLLLLSWLLEAAPDDLSSVPDPLLVGVVDGLLRLLYRGLLLLHLQLIVRQSALCPFLDDLLEYLHVLVELDVELTLLCHLVCIED